VKSAASTVFVARASAGRGHRPVRVARPEARERLTMTLPIAVSVAACGALALAPAIVGFSSAVAAACVWSWWLERHAEPQPLPSGLVSFMAAPRQDGSLGLGPRQQVSRPRLSTYRVLVCMTPDRPASTEIRAAARLADRLGGALFAAYVVREASSTREHRPTDDQSLAANICAAEAVGATVVKIDAEDISEGLVAFADREGVTHAVFGYGGNPAHLLDPETIIGGFASRARGTEVEVIGRRAAFPSVGETRH